MSDKSVIYPSCMRLCIKIYRSLYLLTLPGVRKSFVVNHSTAILPYPPDIPNNGHHISIHKLQHSPPAYSARTQLQRPDNPKLAVCIITTGNRFHN